MAHGDLLIFDLRVLHASHANTTDRWRVVTTGWYYLEPIAMKHLQSTTHVKKLSQLGEQPVYTLLDGTPVTEPVVGKANRDLYA